jgi:glycine/D-amino acid oxidase-like deaminating enzyme
MKIAVLGAGLQGACVALELAARGQQVDLFDKNARPMTQASLMNEGKLHLGYYYANDPTLKTARLVIRGALSFAPLLRRWLDGDIDLVPKSRPYIFAVHRHSLLGVEQVQAHFEACRQIAAESGAAEGDYFGAPFASAIEPFCDLDGIFDPQQVVAAFQTPEIAISAEALAELIRARLQAEPAITLRMCSTVSAVERGDSWCDVSFEADGQASRERYDHVVNALWDGRLSVDATTGIRPARPWLFRTKYDVRIANTPSLKDVPPTSVVLGPFGDVVSYDNGEMYLSWYPAGLQSVSSDLEPSAFAAVVPGTEGAAIRRGTLDGLTNVMPGLAKLPTRAIERSEVRGGVIFAWGASDINDPASDLHTRFDVGPQSYGRYHSVDTGKLTTAPMFARQLCDRILGPS